MSRRESFGGDRWWWLGWALALAIGVWLRVTQLGDQVLVDDEWHALHRLMFADYRDIFLSFGHADYSIPLTLLFKLLSETVGLSEWRMRALPLLFGLATLVMVPVLLRPWLDRRATLVLTALLALSPVLIHFTRFVRPYSITIALGFLAVIALWRWWHDEDRRWLWAFVPATVICAWLHPLTLLFTGGALSWFGWIALYQWWRDRSPAGVLRLVPVGLMAAIPTALLVLPPLLGDPDAMSSKTGVHSLKFRTAVLAWELVAGTANWFVAGPLLVFTLIGAVVLLRRDWAFVLYWLYLTVAGLVIIAWLNPAWVHHALVPIRYLSVALPMVLALQAVGLASGFDLIARRWGGAMGARVPVLGPVLILAALVATGPLPRTYGQFNQFTSSMAYHFDYNFARSPYVRVGEAVEMPEVYRAMAAEPGDWLLIDGPWHFEAHYSPLWNWQRQHRMPMRIGMISGLCTPWTHGELMEVEGKRLRFRHFVHFSHLPWALADQNRFVVLHLTPPMPWADRELPPLEECREMLLRRLGEPWYQDEDRLVFRVERGRAPLE